MVAASMRSSPEDLACSEWRSASAAWGERSKSSPSPAAARRCPRNCLWPPSSPTEPMPIRILLADDHTVVRDGLRSLLEREPDMEIVAEAADGRECIQMAAQFAPDVAIIDVAMPVMNGIEAARRIAGEA